MIWGDITPIFGETPTAPVQTASCLAKIVGALGAVCGIFGLRPWGRLKPITTEDHPVDDAWRTVEAADFQVKWLHKISTRCWTVILKWTCAYFIQTLDFRHDLLMQLISRVSTVQNINVKLGSLQLAAQERLIAKVTAVDSRLLCLRARCNPPCRSDPDPRLAC